MVVIAVYICSMMMVVVMSYCFVVYVYDLITSCYVVIFAL